MEVVVFFAYVALFLALIWLIRRQWEKPQIGNLENKAVFITGCDTGFGRSLALRCLEHGMPVFAGCLNEQGARSLADEARGKHGQLKTLIVNVASEESVENARKFLEEETVQYGGLHGVVNNAGIAGNAAPDDWLNVEDYKQALEVNTFGMIRVAQKLRSLVRKARGRIVNMASSAGRMAAYGIGPYCTSKFALDAYTDVIRQELAVFGVHVAVIEPGFFETPIAAEAALQKNLDRIWARNSEETRREYGEYYLERCEHSPKILKIALAKIAVRHFKFGVSKDISPVVDTYFHALTAVHPRPRYVVGNDAKFFFIPLTYLPTQLADIISRVGRRFSGLPLPAAVKKLNRQHASKR